MNPQDKGQDQDIRKLYLRISQGSTLSRNLTPLKDDWPVHAMSLATRTAAADCNIAVEAVHAHWFIDVMVAKANSSSERSPQVSWQLDNLMTNCFYLCAIITYTQLWLQQLPISSSKVGYSSINIRFWGKGVRGCENTFWSTGTVSFYFYKLSKQHSLQTRRL